MMWEEGGLVKGKLELNKGALDKMVYQNERFASRVQSAAENAKAAPSVKVARFDNYGKHNGRWRVGISDWAGKELKHGTVTQTVKGIHV
ncbi:hypothetical protein ALMA_0581 [Alloscardovia macacae]|uniref:Uncharacterized protein n=1 Tax=Alloscardovia macacae TaxID=1160091 RepID=A0A261F4S4_9BIFI|nr:hypothetical protein ALMA_0581 [Alloscardovia macacae]